MFVLTADLQEQASLSASGALTSAERAQFDMVLEFHGTLREFTRSLLEVAASVMALRSPERRMGPPAGLKASILGAPGDRVQHSREEGFVMTDPDGLARWVNGSFSAMCGYDRAELQGRKPGRILQGKMTDQAAVARIRDAVRRREPVTGS
jgi:PAS domain-containing protein